MKPLTQEYLNDAGCSIPNCGHDHSVLFVHSTCHPRTTPEASYIKASGTLRFTCPVCKKPVAQFLIALHNAHEAMS